MKTILWFFAAALCMGLNSALGQNDGNYSVSETWSVTIYRGTGNVPTTFSGTEVGTLVITNGGYTQISHAGSADLSVLHLTRSIGFDFTSGDYLISGAYPVSGVGGIGIPGQIYAIIQLSFFVVAVQVGETDLPNPWPSQSSVFTTTGASLSSLAGVGKMVDQQANTSGEPSYYINEVDASSTAKVTFKSSLPTGSLQVTINPAAAVSAGALWQVDGGFFQNSGDVVTNLWAGSHTVSFFPISGWTTPSNQTVSITAKATTKAVGNYVQPTGSLQVTIGPAAAISAGAQWQVDGGTWQISGATASGLSVGNHTVQFRTINGWITPSNQFVSVSANSTATVTGTYVLIPPLAVLTTALANAANGAAYTQQLSAINGQPPYAWSLSSGVLPSGLALGANGLISGTPTIDGTFSFTVQVTDALSNEATQVLSLSVGTRPGVRWVQPTNDSMTVSVGKSASLTVTVSGSGPFSYQWQRNGIDLPNGIITTVAGNGTNGYSGDGQAATNAQIDVVSGVALDATGNLFIADGGNHRVRRLGIDGVIDTVAGNGAYGYSGDGGAATNAELWQPVGVAVDVAGNLFIADLLNENIRKVDANGTITTLAGSGSPGYSGDGGPATNAQFYGISGVALDALGNLFIADESNHRVRKLGTNGTIVTVAGNGTNGYAGDGGAATNAELSFPSAVAVDAAGNLFIADFGNQRIRKVDIAGVITTVAGNGFAGYLPAYDGGPATNAALTDPEGLAVDGKGNLFIADTYSDRILRVGTDGLITTVTGNGTQGCAGDGGPAINAVLYFPIGIAADPVGSLFFSDYYNYRIRKIISQGPAFILNNVGLNGAGDYRVIVSSPYGSVTSSVVTVNVALPPGVQFSATPTVGTAPLAVQFNSTNTDSTGNALASWYWTFGDGATSTAQNPTHTYTTAGTCNPGLVGTNNQGVAVIGSGPRITVLAPTSPSCFTYTTSNGNITITGYTCSDTVIGIPGLIGGLPVTGIGAGAFARSGLTSVSLGPNVTNIGDRAFQFCFGLTNVSISGSVTSIGVNAFMGCESLPGISLPDNITSIGVGAFVYDFELTSVTIPSSVTNIGIGAFAYCSGLTNIIVDSNNAAYSSADGVLFDKSQATLLEYPDGKPSTSYTVPGNVLTVGDYAFEGCGLTSVTIPGSVGRIGQGAFYYCSALQNVTLANGLGAIGNWAFYSCQSLSGISIPSSVSTIGTAPFWICLNLVNITVDPQNSFYSSAGGVLFNKSGSVLLEYPDGKAETSYTVPESVIDIGELAFYGANLASLMISSNVTTIAAQAFEECTNLATITIPGSVSSIFQDALAYCPNLTGAYFQGNAPNTDPTAFTGDPKATVYYYCGTAGWSNPFEGLPTVMLCITNTVGAVQVTINPPAAVSAGAQWQVDGGTWQTSGAIVTHLSVGNHAVSFSTITGWIAPADQSVFVSSNSVSTIDGTYTQPTATNYLITVSASPGEAGVVSGGGTFAAGSSRTVTATANGGYVFVNWTENGSVVSSSANYTFMLSSNLNLVANFVSTPGSFNFTTNNGTITITGYTGAGGVVRIPSTINGLPVVRIGQNAFYEKTSVRAVTIGLNVTNIGVDAFLYCNGLTNVTIPGSVTSIGDGAFYSCMNLASVTIPGSVTSMGSEVFGQCRSLKAIIVDAANSSYSSLNGVLFDKSQTTLVEYPAGVGGSYTIPSGVCGVAEAAFYSGSLTNIAIPSTVTNIGLYAFSGGQVIGVTVDAENAFYSSLNGVLFDKSQTTLVEYPGESVESYTIPNGVTSIADAAFYAQYGLTNITIPSSVTSIGVQAFYNCGLASVTLPPSVNSLGGYAFAYCYGLAAANFRGNAPSADCTVFAGDNVTAYYLPGTTGWDSNFACVQTAVSALPFPMILMGASSSGVLSNAFGFTVSWATNRSIIVEVSTNLANPIWLPLQTSALVGGVAHFVDSASRPYSNRFYRVRSQ